MGSDIVIFVIVYNSIMILFVIIFYIVSFLVNNYIKSFHIDLNMLDHQFISITYNCTQIMMEIDKAIVTSNPKIVKIFVIFIVILAHSFPDQDGLKIDGQTLSNPSLSKYTILLSSYNMDQASTQLRHTIVQSYPTHHCNEQEY